MTEPAPRQPATESADAAYEACLDLAGRHYENFPVLVPLLPAGTRRDLAAVYAFCRTTDDLGDEYPGDRLAALDRWEAETRRAVAGDPPPDRPVLEALAETAARRDLGLEPLLRLIEANRMDQTTSRWADEAALLEYCRHSATPVGRMVLAVLGEDDPGLHDYSDATCVGLQLANFWQDIARDWAQGRCYLPLDACARHGVDPEAELDRDTASPEMRGLVAEMVGRARWWLSRGWPLADRLPVRSRALIRGFGRGGWAICDAIAETGFDTLAERPTVSRIARARIVAHELLRAPRRGVDLPRPAA